MTRLPRIFLILSVFTALLYVPNIASAQGLGSIQTITPQMYNEYLKGDQRVTCLVNLKSLNAQWIAKNYNEARYNTQKLLNSLTTAGLDANLTAIMRQTLTDFSTDIQYNPDCNPTISNNCPNQGDNFHLGLLIKQLEDGIEQNPLVLNDTGPIIPPTIPGLPIFPGAPGIITPGVPVLPRPSLGQEQLPFIQATFKELFDYMGILTIDYHKLNRELKSQMGYQAPYAVAQAIIQKNALLVSTVTFGTNAVAAIPIVGWGISLVALPVDIITFIKYNTQMALQIADLYNMGLSQEELVDYAIFCFAITMLERGLVQFQKIAELIARKNTIPGAIRAAPPFITSSTLRRELGPIIGTLATGLNATIGAGAKAVAAVGQGLTTPATEITGVGVFKYIVSMNNHFAKILAAKTASASAAGLGVAMATGFAAYSYGATRANGQAAIGIFASHRESKLADDWINLKYNLEIKDYLEPFISMMVAVAKVSYSSNFDNTNLDDPSPSSSSPFLYVDNVMRSLGVTEDATSVAHRSAYNYYLRQIESPVSLVPEDIKGILASNNFHPRNQRFVGRLITEIYHLDDQQRTTEEREQFNNVIRPLLGLTAESFTSDFESYAFLIAWESNGIQRNSKSLTGFQIEELNNPKPLRGAAYHVWHRQCLRKAKEGVCAERVDPVPPIGEQLGLEE